MEDSQFKNLIIDAYTIGQKMNGLTGIIYGSSIQHGFSEIDDIQYYMNKTNPNMLYLKSKITGVELNVYKDELESYTFKINEKMLYLKLKGRTERLIMI